MDRTSSREHGPLTPNGNPRPGGAADDRAAWRAGRADLREALGPLVRAVVTGCESPEPLDVFREKAGRRRLARGRLVSGEECFFKHYPARHDHPPSHGTWKRAFGLTPAAREFAVLRRLYAAGVEVPEPLALYRFPDGERVLVTRLIEGESLSRACARPHPQLRALVTAVGSLVARLHAAGFSHRDLHGENVWVTADGPILIDLPAALPCSARRLRLRDLGQLDTSLAPWLSLADRVRLRAAALGTARPFSPAARAEIRAVGRASDRRRHARMLSRTRRSLRAGRLYTPWQSVSGRGMRLRQVDEASIQDALDAAPGAEGLQVQRFEHGGSWPGGSPAKRAWLAGHGLRARGIGAPQPCAFLEHRSWGRIDHSTVVMEAPRAPHPEDFGGPIGWLRAVIDLGAALRRDHIDHTELATTPLFIDPRGELGVTGLESIRFPRRISAPACERIDAFVAARVQASDASQTERDAALSCYAARTLFLPGPVARITGPRS